MRRVVLFANEPAPERATRLVSEVGADDAAGLAEALLADLAAALTGGPWECVLAHDGDEPGPVLRSLFAAPWRRRRQGRGDFGDRLRRAFADARRDGASGTVVACADAPTLGAADVAGAFAALETVDAALAPSPAGGWVLIGLAAPVDPSDLFQDVRWSSAGTLDDTLDGFRRSGLGVALLPMRPSVEDRTGLERLRAALLADPDPGLAPRTRAVLAAARLARSA